jgi:hypothetical protein
VWTNLQLGFEIGAVHNIPFHLQPISSEAQQKQRQMENELLQICLSMWAKLSLIILGFVVLIYIIAHGPLWV